MNRAERRAVKDKTLVLKRILITFEDGNTTFLDINKVQLVDRETGEPLFKETKE